MRTIILWDTKFLPFPHTQKKAFVCGLIYYEVVHICIILVKSGVPKLSTLSSTDESAGTYNAVKINEFFSPKSCINSYYHPIYFCQVLRENKLFL